MYISSIQESGIINKLLKNNNKKKIHEQSDMEHNSQIKEQPNLVTTKSMCRTHMNAVLYHPCQEAKAA
jgi:hypothetical protein